jgi:hypothetical protein
MGDDYRRLAEADCHFLSATTLFMSASRPRLKSRQADALIRPGRADNLVTLWFLGCFFSTKQTSTALYDFKKLSDRLFLDVELTQLINYIL